MDGPVMQGIGTLNETARNMFRGPSGVGAYQQFADGGEAMQPYFDVGFVPGEKELRTSGQQVVDGVVGFASALDPVQGIMRGMRASGRAFDNELTEDERKAAAVEAALETLAPLGMVGMGALAKQPAKAILMDVLAPTGAPASVAEDTFDPSRRAFLKNAVAAGGIAAIAPDIVTEIFKKAAKSSPKGSLGGLMKTLDDYNNASAELYRQIGQLAKKTRGKATDDSMAARKNNLLIDEKTAQEMDETRPIVEEIKKLKQQENNNRFLYNTDLRNGVEDLTPDQVQQATNDEIEDLFGNIENSAEHVFESIGDTDGFQNLLSEAKQRGMGDELNEGMDPNLYGQDAGKYPTTWQMIRDFSEDGYASGGEVMQGVGALNETARSMFRGPSGVGAYQQFADGGPVYMSNGGDSSLNNASFEALLSAVIQTESGGDPNAVSEDDAIGLMQVLPTTAAKPGYEQYGAENVFDIAERLIGYDGQRTVEDARNLLFDPEVNREFGTKYLKAMIETTGGDIYGALQKYNAGPGNYANFEDDPVKNPLDQEAVRYPELVIGALGIDPEGMLPQTGSMTFAAPQSTEFDAFQPNLPTLGTPPPANAPLAVEELMEQKQKQNLTEKYSTENIGEQLRKEYFMPKTGMEEDTFPPQDTSPPMLEKIQDFFDKFAPPKKPERVITPKPTPLQYRSV